MKISTLFIALLSLLVATSVAVAGNASGLGADPSQAIELNGTVISITSASGSGMPMLTVDDPDNGTFDVALGPVWFLQAQGFSAVEGDSVSLLVYACPTCAVSAVAVWVENLTNITYVDLRDEDGRPLWTNRQYQRNGAGRPGQGNGSGGQNGGGQGGGTGGGGGGGTGGGQPGGSGNGTGSGPANGSGLDMSLVETVRGDVVDFTGHAGSGQPVLTLDVQGKAIYEITVSPYGPIAAAGLVIEPGMDLTVVFAPTECTEDPHLVTISIRDEGTGVLVQLRDPETGFPMASGGGHNRPNWP